jgi:tetratricopeptide (TPR) repeat protein
MPVIGHMRAHLRDADRIFVDETRAPVLDPGRKATKSGFFWAVVSDDRGHGGTGPPIVLCHYAPGRGKEHPLKFLAGYRGRFLQCDAYQSYDALTGIAREGGPWQLVYCWTHVRRRFVKRFENERSPIADLGRREEALAAVEEAAGLYRALAAARPGVFRPYLANALNTLSNRLSALGRHEDALAAVEEAVKLYHALAAARPDAFRPDLAGTLNNLSNRLSDLGRRDEALMAIEEAAGLYRALAAARPDAFRAELASALNNLSKRLSALGRREEALAAVEEAVEIRRALAAARPDAFRPDLANALNKLSIWLSDLGRRKDALAAVEEAVGLYRALAAERPTVYAEALATALWVMSDRLEEVDAGAAAVSAHREALEVLMPLLQRHTASLAPKAVALTQGYVQRGGRTGVGLDEELLSAIIGLLHSAGLLNEKGEE